MRRAFFFIVAVCLATSSFASIPRASMLDASSTLRASLPETRIRVFDVVTPFAQPHQSGLTRALRQAYEQSCTTNASGLSRFLSVDPVVDVRRAMHNPQAWNRYSYVVNNPMKYTDPTGKLFQLTGCVNGNGTNCGDQMALIRHAFGSQWHDAMQYLKLGKNGMLTLNGISAAQFGKQFGNVGHGLAMLISNQSATFKLWTVQSPVGGGGATSVDGRQINVATGLFPRGIGGLKGVGAVEAFVHELGHAVGSLIPGYAEQINARSALSPTTSETPRNEAYATNFESQWRADVLGLGPRPAYHDYNDYIYLGHTPLFPDPQP